MEGVGARLGRSSTRYGGPATVFSGPVRKWKKKWVPLAAATTANNNNNNHNSSSANPVLYKWTPLSRDRDSNNGDAATPVDEPPRRKFRYVPVAVIEEQKQEAAAKTDDKNKHDYDHSAPQPPQTDGSEGKPDENDVKEASQGLGKDGDPIEEGMETSLDLNLGFKAQDDSATDPKTGEEDESSEQLEGLSTGEDVEMRNTVVTQVASRKKRKAAYDL